MNEQMNNNLICFKDIATELLDIFGEDVFSLLYLNPVIEDDSMFFKKVGDNCVKIDFPLVDIIYLYEKKYWNYFLDVLFFKLFRRGYIKDYKVGGGSVLILTVRYK